MPNVETAPHFSRFRPYPKRPLPLPKKHVQTTFETAPPHQPRHGQKPELSRKEDGKKKTL